MINAASLTTIFAILALVCLLALHFASPEFQPSWRMISEYALGKHKWLITLFFVFWGLSSFSLAAYLWPRVGGTWVTVGVVLLVISGIGEIMGGLFDLKHKLHGAAFLLGVPALPVAALLIGYYLTKETPHTLTLAIAHSTWISMILMGVSLAILMTGFKNAGYTMDQNMTPPEKLPDGVIGVVGYANRLLILCYVGWLLLIANTNYSFKY